MGQSAAPFISVIVPVYNVEAYLHQCIRSIVDQNYRACELILVDDGSTDRSGAMCDEYAADNPCVRAIHKPNGGLSDARNAGIAAATGEYLLFVDGDDYVAEGSLERIAHALVRDNCPDVMFLNARMVYPDGSETPYGRDFVREDFYGIDRDSVLGRLASGGQFHVSAWYKAVRRSLVNEVGGFWKDVVGEDVDFSTAVYLAAGSYSVCAGLWYLYRQQREGSITAQNTDRRLQDLLRIIQKWIAIARGDPRCRWIYRLMYHQYYTLLLLYARASCQVKTRSVRRNIRDLAFLLRYADCGKGPVLRLFFLLGGVGLSSRMFNWLERG